MADQLARWQLAAERLGCSIRLRDARPPLLELLELVGLIGVIEVVDLGIQVVGEAERGEQAGVEEVVVADDPVV